MRPIFQKSVEPEEGVGGGGRVSPRLIGAVNLSFFFRICFPGPRCPPVPPPPAQHPFYGQHVMHLRIPRFARTNLRFFFAPSAFGGAVVSARVYRQAEFAAAFAGKFFLAAPAGDCYGRKNARFAQRALGRNGTPERVNPSRSTQTQSRGFAFPLSRPAAFIFPLPAPVFF